MNWHELDSKNNISSHKELNTWLSGTSQIFQNMSYKEVHRIINYYCKSFTKYCLHFLVKSDTIQDFYLTSGQLWAPSYWEIKNFCALLKLIITSKQRGKKVVSDSLGLVDFSIGLVNSVLNLPERQMKFFQEFTNYRRTVMNTAYSNSFSG